MHVHLFRELNTNVQNTINTYQAYLYHHQDFPDQEEFVLDFLPLVYH